MAKLKMKGIIPPVVTPFKENGDVDYNSYVANIEKWNEANLSGYLALGSNSETVYLNEEEKLNIIKETVQTAKKDRLIMAGTGMESTRETINLTNKAAKVGAQAALVLTPFYYGNAMTSKALIEYFTTVADHSDIPVLIYNVPKFTNINIKIDALQVLSEHPNIVGMKDSSGNVPQLANFKRLLPEDFNIAVGTASALFPALALGIDFAIMALANSHPDECADVMNAYEKGNLDKAKQIYQTLFPINTAVTETYGIPGLKHACNLMGYAGGYVRKPLTELKQQDKEEIKKIVFKNLPISETI